MSREVDIDRLLFDEYTRIMVERAADEHGNSDTPKLTF